MSRKSKIAGVVSAAAVAVLAAGCVTEPAYNLPQTMPAPGQPSYGTSPYYGYGSGYYGNGYYGNGYYGYGPGYYDPMYYGSARPYPYYYGYPVIVRCPDNNRDGRCDKHVKNGRDDDDGDHDGDHDGHHRGDNDGRDHWQPGDNTKYRRDARGQVPVITPKTGLARPQEAAAPAPSPRVAPAAPAARAAPTAPKSPAVMRGNDDARPAPRRMPPRDVDPRTLPQR